MIQLEHISKIYKTGALEQKALDDITLNFRNSEFVSVLGTSGSGKTTLLNIIGGLDRATSGELIVDGISTKDYTDADWDTYRNHHIGFIFQSYNLIPHQTLLQNVELALTLSGVGAEERKERAIQALERVGLEDHLDKKPSQISGGQAQRVAIARALINNPDIILADEPTGALDTTTGIQIMDLLKEVSEERMVIMVTHNPDLAETYSSRIVRLKDGRVIDDSHPYFPPEEQVEADERRALANQSKRHAHMKFSYALNLSFHNLMTKKGRTFLTAFAGSIGIIGIAAILALSNGINEYIKNTEEELMSTTPVTIQSETSNLATMFQQGGNDSHSTEENLKKDIKPTQEIPTEGNMQDDALDAQNQVIENNLKAFKKYIDAGGGDIKKLSSSVQYNYNVNPVVLKKDGKTGEVATVNQTLNLNGYSSFAMPMAMGGGQSGSIFSPMSTNFDVAKKEYRCVTGHWPENDHQAVLALSRTGTISDDTLYALGIISKKDVETYERQRAKRDNKSVRLKHEKFTYEDALGLKYQLVSPALLYKQGPNGTWESQDTNESFLKQVYDSGTQVEIVGVVQPKTIDAKTNLGEGVHYSRELTPILMKQSASAQITKDQLAHPAVDVFTGESFKAIQEGNRKGLGVGSFLENGDSMPESLGDLQDMAGSAAMSDMASSLETALADPSAWTSPDDFKFSPEDLLSSISTKKLLQALERTPLPDLEDLGQVDIPEENQVAIQSELFLIAQKFVASFLPQAENITSLTEAQRFISAFLDRPDIQQSLKKLQGLIGVDNLNQLRNFISNYLENQLYPYAKTQLAEISNQVTTAIMKTVGTTVADHMNQLQAQVAAALTRSMAESTERLSALSALGSLDSLSSMRDSLKFAMSEQDIAATIENYYHPQSTTYKGNLQQLGYAVKDDPSSIDIYPKDFNAKNKIKDAIQTYNDKVIREGKPNDKITYTDLLANIVGQVSSIITMISTVLIAFVSISLVVSSIMIGIITYISVLERKKEIGILRALGASKRNIANVFNAETFIEGLISGIFAILVIYLVSIPVNAYVYAWKNIPNILALPWQSALLLIGISVLLTLIAGLIPSQKAARRDPVEALRSE